MRVEVVRPVPEGASPEIFARERSPYCEKLCAGDERCLSFDMHRNLPRCYLNTVACDDPSDDDSETSLDWDTIVKTVTPDETDGGDGSAAGFSL